VPSRALGLDGVSVLYAAEKEMAASAAWSDRAAEGLEARGLRVHRGPSVTWPTLMNPPIARALEWRDAGNLGVDMETACTLAVARRFGAAGVSMLVAWDEVLAGRTFLDRLPQDEAAALARAEDAVFEVALALALAVDDPAGPT
jgi:purine-nucleoside phosphorylase